MVEGSSPSPVTLRRMKRKPFQTSLLRLVVIVAACGLIAWAWGRVVESRRPPTTQTWLIALQEGNAEERNNAAQKLVDATPAAALVVVPALVRALNDNEVSVRSRAARSLHSNPYRSA